MKRVPGPTACTICGEPIQQNLAGGGRPRLYCSSRCRWRGSYRQSGTRRTPVARFESFLPKTAGPEDCWEWQGKRDRTTGYGRFSVSGAWMGAHRWSYEYHVGPVPDGLVLDHLCRNRTCVNPVHLEPVPEQVNIVRGMAPSAIAYRTNICQRGHEFTPENTYWRPDKPARQCRECARMRQRRRYAA